MQSSSHHNSLRYLHADDNNRAFIQHLYGYPAHFLPIQKKGEEKLNFAEFSFSTKILKLAYYYRDE
jgi:hypothetical protein